MLLASLACLLVAPETAMADCSSHERPTIASAIDPLSIDLGRGSVDATEAPVVPRPCTGPTCSGRPKAPDSAVSPPIIRIGLWAILEVASDLAPPQLADLSADDGPVSPTRSALVIFHPPRPSPSHFTS